jgi:hypothetical protein
VEPKWLVVLALVFTLAIVLIGAWLAVRVDVRGTAVLIPLIGAVGRFLRSLRGKP